MMIYVNIEKKIRRHTRHGRTPLHTHENVVLYARFVVVKLWFLTRKTWFCTQNMLFQMQKTWFLTQKMSLRLKPRFHWEEHPLHTQENVFLYARFVYLKLWFLTHKTSFCTQKTWLLPQKRKFVTTEMWLLTQKMRFLTQKTWFRMWFLIHRIYICMRSQSWSFLLDAGWMLITFWLDSNWTLVGYGLSECLIPNVNGHPQGILTYLFTEIIPISTKRKSPSWNKS